MWLETFFNCDRPIVLVTTYFQSNSPKKLPLSNHIRCFLKLVILLAEGINNQWDDAIVMPRIVCVAHEPELRNRFGTRLVP
jgi:hypothetical protein